MDHWQELVPGLSGLWRHDGAGPSPRSPSGCATHMAPGTPAGWRPSRDRACWSLVTWLVMAACGKGRPSWGRARDLRNTRPKGALKHLYDYHITPLFLSSFSPERLRSGTSCGTPYIGGTPTVLPPAKHSVIEYAPASGRVAESTNGRLKLATVYSGASEQRYGEL